MNDEWTKIRPDGKKVTFTYREFGAGLCFITREVEGRSTVDMINTLKAPLTRKQVERQFAGDH